jgi:hypothetical protein
MYLQSGNAFFAGEHEIDDFEPCPHRDISVFEDRSDKHGEPIAALWNAFGTLPVKGPIGDWIDVLIATARTHDALRPPASGQILLAGVVSREQLIKLRNCHLLSELDRTHRDYLHA